ncbi:hypothetical protein BLOT_013092 [Blomia tropicalis]|nr:hypothetical protein BLOT_013092 [Blomia tropicalis]
MFENLCSNANIIHYKPGLRIDLPLLATNINVNIIVNVFDAINFVRSRVLQTISWIVPCWNH